MLGFTGQVFFITVMGLGLGCTFLIFVFRVCISFIHRFLQSHKIIKTSQVAKPAILCIYSETACTLLLIY